MIFLEVIKNKKFTLISVLLFLYVILNLIDGERGLISYFEKKEKMKKLLVKKEILISKLDSIEKQNDLLTGIVDNDYLEILYRKKFMVGKKSEIIFVK